MNKSKSICPLQAYDPNSPLVINTILPKWEKREEDTVCSHCGSWHPLEFLNFLKTVVESDDVKIRIEINSRGNKIYIQRPHIKNASEGAIKIYIAHLKRYCEDMEYDVSEIDKQIHQAVLVSQKKFKIHSDQLMEDLKG